MAALSYADGRKSKLVSVTEFALFCPIFYIYACEALETVCSLGVDPEGKINPFRLLQACLDDTSVVLCVLLSSKMIRGDVDTVKLNEPSQNLEVKQKKHHLRRVPRRGPEGAFP